MTFDAVVFHAINGLARQSPLLDWVGVVFAEWLTYLMGLVIILLWFRPQEAKVREADRFAILNALWVGILASLAKWGIGLVIARPRPFVDLVVHQLIPMAASSPSFPSGHATFAFGVAVSVLLEDRRFGLPLLVAAALVGFGRIFVGVHYPSDVLAGAMLGTLLAFSVHLVGFKVDRRLVAIVSRFTDRFVRPSA